MVNIIRQSENPEPTPLHAFPGTPSDPHPANGALIEFQCRPAMDHHDDAQFLLAIWAQRPGKGCRACQPYIVFGEGIDHAFDQAALPRFEIAEEQVSALAMDVDYLSCRHW
jgi:hypothetical protein